MFAKPVTADRYSLKKHVHLNFFAFPFVFVIATTACNDFRNINQCANCYFRVDRACINTALLHSSFVLRRHKDEWCILEREYKKFFGTDKILRECYEVIANFRELSLLRSKKRDFFKHRNIRYNFNWFSQRSISNLHQSQWNLWIILLDIMFENLLLRRCSSHF